MKRESTVETFILSRVRTTTCRHCGFDIVLRCVLVKRYAYPLCVDVCYQQSRECVGSVNLVAKG